MGEEAYEKARTRQLLAYAALNEMSRRRAQRKLETIIFRAMLLGGAFGFVLGAIVVLFVWAVWG